MTGTPLRTIIATMVVSFAVSFSVLWSERAPRGVSRTLEPSAARPGPFAPAAAQWPAVSSAAGPIATQALPAPALTKGQTPADVPPFDDAGPPLPVVLSVSTRPAPAGEETDASTPGVVRQIDLMNQSNEPLDLAVLVADVPTQQSTRAALFVAPHAEAHVGIESGLKIEPGDVVTLHGRGFRAVTQTVP